MYPTAEVRWFIRGTIPPDVDAWFRRGPGKVHEEPVRTDRYLQLPGSEGLNVKMREGLIEIKQRVGPVDVVRFHDRVSGLVEQWRKWRFQLAAPDAARSETDAPSWIAVRKARRLRTYRVTGEKEVVVLSDTETPVSGCELELTTVRVAGRAWWTVALEAFGDRFALRDNLLFTAEHVFRGDDVPTLKATDSRGYAAWLDVMAGQEEKASWED